MPGFRRNTGGIAAHSEQPYKHNAREVEMARTRQHMKDEQQNATRKMADEASRAARAMADVSERTARAGAEMVQRNAEAIQQAWQSGNELATRSTEQFARALGITGEEAQNARQQSLRNLEVIAQSNTTLAQGVQSISLECFEFARRRMAHNLDWFDAFMRCRTAQELIAVQSDFVRDNLEDVLQISRRMAELSIRMADQEIRNVSETLELAPGDLVSERPSKREHAQHAPAHQAAVRRTAKPARMARNTS
jgi:hypothetical protein